MTPEEAELYRKAARLRPWLIAGLFGLVYAAAIVLLLVLRP